MTYTDPYAASAALITIDVQEDFTRAGGALPIAGTEERLGSMRRLLQAFRQAGRPIVHVVRLYLPDGSNVDNCRRAAIERGARLVAPGTAGAELAAELKPAADAKLDATRLLQGKLQLLGANEWAIYKPRWDAFHDTALENHLRGLGVDTLVFCGCNFPNCPRSSIYGATQLDFRVVAVADAISGIYEQGLTELKNIGVSVMNTGDCVDWIAQARNVPAYSDDAYFE
jgi:nicotinamidase-related amidase